MYTAIDYALIFRSSNRGLDRMSINDMSPETPMYIRQTQPAHSPQSPHLHHATRDHRVMKMDLMIPP